MGMKSRGVYETPGGTVLYAAHAALETLCIDRDTQHYKEVVANRFAELVYFGQWFTTAARSTDPLLWIKRRNIVTGEVTLKLYKGNVMPAGIESPYSLYSEGNCHL